MKNNLALVTLLGIFCALPVVAKDMCGEHEVSFKGTQKPDHNEFVYSTKAAYNQAQGCSKGTDCKIDKGLVYECDNTYCTNASWLLTDTNDFFWNGSQQEKFTLFICSTGVTDRWKNYGVLSKCSGDDITSDGVSQLVNQGTQFKVLWDKKNMKHCYLGLSESATKPYTLLGSNTVQELVSKQGDPCTAAQLKQINATEGALVRILVTADGKLQCSATKCIDGFEKVNVNGAIHCKKSKVGEPCSAADLNAANATAGKYIKVGNKVSCAASACKPGAYSVYRDDVYQGWCVFPSYCKAGSHLEIIDGTKTKLKCISDTNPTVVEEPDDDDFESPVDDTPTGDDNVVDDNNPDNNADNTKQNTFEPVVLSTAAIEKKITDAYKEFGNLTNDLKTKKWRNADGKFNTARLASDGVAGVVLGTTAGLVTAHVVKKGQIKNGYEDIKCSIGGQTVSDWGDELTVGVR